MVRTSNRRRYLRYDSLKGLGRDRLDRLRADIAEHGGPEGRTTTVFTWVFATDHGAAASHEYASGDGPFVLTNNANPDDLPAGLEAGVLYWLNRIASGSFSLHTSKADAIADTDRVPTTDDGTGIHTLEEITKVDIKAQ